MVRCAEIDRQALAVAAAQCIYRYYHPVCNAGDLRWRHAIRLRRENDITSKREGQMIKKLQLLTKLYFNRPFWKKKKTPQLEVWCQIFFKKLNSENSYELVDTDANKPGPLQLPTAMRFFDKLITVCANLLFSPKYTKMIEQGCVCLLIAKCLMPQKEQNINALMLSCEVYMTFANSTTHKRTPQDCPGDGM